MNKRIQRLPSAIISHIISYTYHGQDRKLLNDLENFHETRGILMCMYQKYWLEEYADWLMNDILSYMNHYKATIYGYTHHFYTIFQRMCFFKTADEFHRYLMRLKEKRTTTRINLLLGAFNLQERNDFLIECEKHLL